MKIQELIDSAIHQLDLLSDENGIVRVSDVLPQPMLMENYCDATYPSPDEFVIKEVRLDQLHPIQEDVERDHVYYYLIGRGRTDELIVVVQNEAGQLLIQDGHHRVVAAWLKDDVLIQAKVAVVKSVESDDNGEMVIQYFKMK